MSFVLVFVAGNPDLPLTPGHLAEVERFLDDASLRFSTKPSWLHIHKAAEIGLGDKPNPEQLAVLKALLDPAQIDVFVTSSEHRRKNLLIADMDATIVTTETLDELAEFAGLKDKISAITARAMAGELDFAEALHARVAMLKDLPVSALQATLDATVYSPGAETLIRVMRHAGATCVLVSGGFTFFTKAVAHHVGFNFNHGNSLGMSDGKLTGEVTGAILDKHAKLRFLQDYSEKMGLEPAQTLAVGDGANDLPMLEAAGLGLGYQPKPLLLERLENCIVHTELTSALYIQGYTWQEIESALHSDTSPAGPHN